MKYDRILLDRCHHCGSTNVTTGVILKWGYRSPDLVNLCDYAECRAWMSESISCDKEFITLEEAQLIVIKERL